jgi:type IV secretory pathway VirB2 component (pilin)
MLKLMSENPAMFALTLAIAAAVMMLPEMAMASGTPIAKVLCTVVGWFTGAVGKGIATLAIIVIGVGALMGKVSWGMAIIVGVGVAVIFGAEQIVDQLGAGTYDCTTGVGL